jgi:vacuolar-type H+-ATPase subunit F/Vma7
LIRFAADEDLDNHIVRGLRHRLTGVDIVRVQEAQLTSAADNQVLAWAAESNCVLLSHDASTMTAAAYERLKRGERMPGVIIVPQWLSVGSVVEELLVVAECSVPADWADQVRFLPLA